MKSQLAFPILNRSLSRTKDLLATKAKWTMLKLARRSKLQWQARSLQRLSPM
jgi:hypothetical protein